MSAAELEPRSGMTDEVLYARDGCLGRIMLNRPEVINALTSQMVSSVLAQLEDWARDDTVATVSIQGAGERGLCSGGDVRALRSVLMQGSAGAVQFWAQEYRMNAAIDSYPNPFVAFMDGIVMGGGVGISAHGSLRLVTERSRVAMPETAIGYFPDVGSLFLLSRAPGEIGTYLAMTGLAVGGADAVTAGLADALIESRDIPGLVQRLTEGESLDADVGSASTVGSLEADRDWIDSCYAGNDPVEILEALRAHPAPAARRCADVLQTRSPLAVAVALEAIRRASRMDTLAEVLDQDLMLGSAFASSPDFVEGVRALLVDRDNAPRWRHGSLKEVDPAEVTRLFTATGAEAVAAASRLRGAEIHARTPAVRDAKALERSAPPER